MILSMTGFGKATGTFKGKTITADVKSLNGKTSDIRIKAPNNYRNKEILIRNIVAEEAIRGKLEVNVTVASDNGDDDFGLNTALFKKYFNELSTLQNTLKYSTQDLFSAILRIPNVVSIEEREIDDEEWAALEKTIKLALDDLNGFRKIEGNALERDIEKNIEIIMEKQAAIAPFENARIERLRSRMKKNLDEFLGKENVDLNRFEQEVMFYIEKLDVNEEKVRLHQHCLYFLEVLRSDEKATGKKLNFISQEIGREINTLGSKAQDSNIQQYVVQMKESLEQIKEQLANVV